MELEDVDITSKENNVQETKDTENNVELDSEQPQARVMTRKEDRGFVEESFVNSIWRFFEELQCCGTETPRYEDDPL